MNTYLSAHDEKSCYGCLSCVYSCPAGAISIEDRFDGFSFPVVDADKCIDCHLCRQVCPNDTAGQLVSPIRQTFALRHNQTDVRKHSSSGGAFTAVSDSLMRDGYKVYGAVFEETFRSVRHIGSRSTQDRDRMRLSKYVESSLKDVYPAIKNDLENGENVFFSGTPCQVAGLKAFLRKPYDGLFTMDFVCHGVFSPRLISDYIELLSNGSRVSFFAFRDNIHHNWESSQTPYIDCEDTTNLKYLPHCYKLLTRGLGRRTSCSACKFAQSSRPADITVGDLWSADWLCPALKDDSGVSFFAVNTEKGRALLQKLEADCTVAALDKDKAVQGFYNLSRPTPPSNIHEMFWKYYRTHSAKKTIENYGGDSLKSKLMRKPFEYINARRKKAQ